MPEARRDIPGSVLKTDVSTTNAANKDTDQTVRTPVLIRTPTLASALALWNHTPLDCFPHIPTESEAQNAAHLANHLSKKSYPRQTDTNPRARDTPSYLSWKEEEDDEGCSVSVECGYFFALRSAFCF